MEKCEIIDLRDSSPESSSSIILVNRSDKEVKLPNSMEQHRNNKNIEEFSKQDVNNMVSSLVKVSNSAVQCLTTLKDKGKNKNSNSNVISLYNNCPEILNANKSQKSKNSCHLGNSNVYQETGLIHQMSLDSRAE